MKDNIYLYNTEDVPEIPREFVVRRVELLNEHLTELLEVHYRERDIQRYQAVVKAIRFWEELK